MNEKYNEKYKIHNTQRAVQTRIHSATYNQQQRTWKGMRKRRLKLVIFYSVLTVAKRVLYE